MCTAIVQFLKTKDDGVNILIINILHSFIYLKNNPIQKFSN